MDVLNNYIYWGKYEYCCEDDPNRSSGDRRYCTTTKSHFKQIFSLDMCNISAEEIEKIKQQMISNFQEILSKKISYRLTEGLNDHHDFTVKNVKRNNRREVFVKVRFPNSLGVQGVHANPYWLSMHRTTVQNQQLHRARIIWHSWFCSSISPDQAMETNQVPSKAELDKVSQYFAENDQHAKGDRNCFDCHRRIQPVANYFGKMSVGYPYDKQLRPEELIKSYLQIDDQAFSRPGGYYNPRDGKITNTGYGLEGLANLLPHLPKVHRCVVNSTWNEIFGSKWSLTSDELATAVKFFADSGFNYRKLLTHLLTKKKAINYFTVSHDKFYDMVDKQKQQATCDELTPEVIASGAQIIKDTCVYCHSSGEYSDFFANPEQQISAVQLQEVYRRITSTGNDVMPQSNEWFDSVLSPEKQKQIVECYLHDKAKSLAITLNKTDGQSNKTIEAIHEMPID